MGPWKNMKKPISLEEYAEEGSAQPPSVSLDGNPGGFRFGEGGLLDIGDKQPIGFTHQSSAASQEITGVRRMPDGSTRPDADGGYGYTFESNPEASGAGIGQAGNSTAMKTKIKRGGLWRRQKRRRDITCITSRAESYRRCKGWRSQTHHRNTQCRWLDWASDTISGNRPDALRFLAL